MRAVTVPQPGGPEALVLADVPTPTPGPDEVLIAVTAAGVNRADLMQRQGHYPPPPGAPDILGLECAGTIAAVGHQVSDWAEGDACVALLAGGGQAEFVVAPAGQVISPPAGVDPVTAGGLIEVAATVLSNVHQAGLVSGHTVLVHGGAGGIGSFAIQYAAAIGARVLTTAGSAAKLDYCRDLGADDAFDYHQDWAAAVQQATDGRGVDVILDVMGAKYLEANLASLATDGRLMIIGLQGGTKATIDLGAMLPRRLSVATTTLRARPVAQKTAICADVERLVWPLFSQGRITPGRHTTVALAEVAQAHRALESGDNVGKIVLTV